MKQEERLEILINNGPGLLSGCDLHLLVDTIQQNKVHLKPSTQSNTVVNIFMVYNIKIAKFYFFNIYF